MKAPLIAIMAVSLAANAVLAVYVLRQPATPRSSVVSEPSGNEAKPSNPAVSAANATSSSGQSVAGGGAISPTTWDQLKPTGDLHEMVSRLRAAGFPPSVVRMIVHQMVSEKMAGKNPQANLPYWKRNAMNKDMMVQMQAHQAERTAMIESALGPDAKLSSAMDPAFRNQRYGNLPDDKIDAISQIEKDYSDLMAQRMMGANPAEMSKRMQERELLEKEKRNDIAALLTPDELEHYELRSSRSASQMMHQLRNVDVSEDEFKTLYRFQKALDDAHPQGPGMNPESMTARMAAQRELGQQVRSVLGDERYYQYLEANDHNFATAKGFVEKFPSLPPSATLQLYDLQTQVQTSMMSAGRISQEERMSRMQGFNQQLESILGAEAAAEYRKQGQGRMFMMGSGPAGAIRIDGR